MRRALDELDPNLDFHLSDALRQRWLADSKLIRREAEAALLNQDCQTYQTLRIDSHLKARGRPLSPWFSGNWVIMKPRPRT
jgi:hypothetical protein